MIVGWGCDHNQLIFGRIWQLLGWGLVAAIIVFSLIPSPPTPPTGWDKLNHLIGYGVLMWWFRQAFPARWSWVLGLFGLGVALEFAQAATGYRQFEAADMVANACGLLVGLLVALTPLGSTLWWLESLWSRIRQLMGAG